MIVTKLNINLAINILVPIRHYSSHINVYKKYLETNSKTSDDMAEFSSTYQQFSSDVFGLVAKESLEAAKLTEQIFEYNMGGGKRFKAAILFETCRILEKFSGSTNVDMFDAYILAWCIEMESMGVLISDDITDRSEFRRGVPCWYKLPHVGEKAVNDFAFIHSLTNIVLSHYFKNKPFFHDISNLMRIFTHHVYLGQILDCGSMISDGKGWERFTLQNHRQIATYKLASPAYNCTLSMALALCGQLSEQNIKTIAAPLDEIGYFYQIRNDFTDWCCDASETGKIGNDIESGTLTWFAVKALEKGNSCQKDIITSNYGRRGEVHDKEVKKVYNELDLKNEYLKQRELSRDFVLREISKFKDEALKHVVLNVLHFVYNLK